MRTTLRTSATGLGTGIALATAAVLIVTTSTASGEHQSSSSAYGISAGGTPGQPAVESDGSQTVTGGGQMPAQLGLLAAGGALSVSAGNDQASAAITDLTLGQGVAQLPQALKDDLASLSQACTVVEQGGDADQLIDPLNAAIDQVPGLGQVEVPSIEAATTFCNGLLDTDILSVAKVGTLVTQCTDQTGTVTLAGTEVLGAQQPLLAGEVAPDTQLLPPELADVARITLNHQVRDGENFTVEGMRIEVGGEVVAVLASATCGAPIADPVVEEEQEEPKKRKSAPVPEPVQTSAPVTG